MLILCTSCNSKYLINSADLKPDGRTLQCANCGYQWYQGSSDEELGEAVLPLSTSESSTTNNSGEKKTNFSSSNLPSTYVKEQQASVVNSTLVVIFLLVIITFFFLLKKLEINSLVLIKFYIEEFYFNLKLIFADLSLIIYHILN